jgi:ferritin-like metal-binding protein YciE
MALPLPDYPAPARVAARASAGSKVPGTSLPSRRWPVKRSVLRQLIEARATRNRPQPSNKKGTPPMGLFSRDIKTMDDLFAHMLQDIYYAENQIVKSLPEMIDKTSDRELGQALKSHLEETKTHVKRLESAFQMCGQQPEGTNCPALDGIIEEADEVDSEVADERVLNAAIIAGAQAVEHYEITRYGTLIAWAKELGHDDVAKLLSKTLGEEKAADKKLTAIAERQVNQQAAMS